jgi:hypothetical protein
MRMMMAAAIAVAVLCSAIATADGAERSQCSDRNALNSISVDARLVAIKYFFAGLVRGLTDRNRQACYEAHALNDVRLAIVNKTFELIERDCLPIEEAARIAAEAACP